LRKGFWLVIAPSLLSGVTLLIAPLRKPKTIMSRVDSVVFAKALNVASSAPCSCQAFLASTLLNVRAKAPLGSFLNFICSIVELVVYTTKIFKILNKVSKRLIFFIKAKV
jgi:hypothetical protein